MLDDGRPVSIPGEPVRERGPGDSGTDYQHLGLLHDQTFQNIDGHAPGRQGTTDFVPEYNTPLRYDARRT
ncbi:hypothetical protein GCM10009754_15970 [Amycolatopsis minnesotensis]|uniref:Uncharacterized protein n=1 Tax=Amycolatopsis minnesotensis TaxID=337894 RepID=A0ABN2QCP8_9PSEU